MHLLTSTWARILKYILTFFVAYVATSISSGICTQTCSLKFIYVGKQLFGIIFDRKSDMYSDLSSGVHMYIYIYTHGLTSILAFLLIYTLTCNYSGICSELNALACGLTCIRICFWQNFWHVLTFSHTYPGIFFPLYLNERANGREVLWGTACKPVRGEATR